MSTYGHAFSLPGLPQESYTPSKKGAVFYLMHLWCCNLISDDEARASLAGLGYFTGDAAAAIERWLAANQHRRDANAQARAEWRAKNPPTSPPSAPRSPQEAPCRDGSSTPSTANSRTATSPAPRCAPRDSSS